MARKTCRLRIGDHSFLGITFESLETPASGFLKLLRILFHYPKNFSIAFHNRIIFAFRLEEIENQD
jgi:hypothetical protein